MNKALERVEEKIEKCSEMLRDIRNSLKAEKALDCMAVYGWAIEDGTNPKAGLRYRLIHGPGGPGPWRTTPLNAFLAGVKGTGIRWGGED